MTRPASSHRRARARAHARARARARTLAVLLSLTAAAGASATAATTATAAPRQTRMARFLVSFEGERTVGWDEPRWSPRYDCQHVYWTESIGEERWQVKAKPQKALLWLTSYGDVNFHIGTWDPREITEEYAFRGNGMVARERTDRSGFDPNDRCGPATAQVDPPRPDDCGTRLPRERVSVRIRRGLVTVGVGHEYNRYSEVGYRACALIVPPGAPSDWPDEVTGKVKVADLFNPRRGRIVVEARRGWGHVSEIMGGKGRRAESAGVRWTLTLERVPDRGAPATRRPARGRR